MMALVPKAQNTGTSEGTTVIFPEIIVLVPVVRRYLLI